MAQHEFWQNSCFFGKNTKFSRDKYFLVKNKLIYTNFVNIRDFSAKVESFNVKSIFFSFFSK